MKGTNCIICTKTQQKSHLSTGQATNQLLDGMSKVMEKSLYRQIYPALSCHIPDDKFAFLTGDMTLQLIRFRVCITNKFSEPTDIP
jgi:hypothetical protein